MKEGDSLDPISFPLDSAVASQRCPLLFLFFFLIFLQYNCNEPSFLDFVIYDDS